jgi:hypothetical protein
MLLRFSTVVSTAFTLSVLGLSGCGGGDGGSSGGTAGGTGIAGGGAGAGTSAGSGGAAAGGGSGGAAHSGFGGSGGAAHSGFGGSGGSTLAGGASGVEGKFEVPTMKIDVLGGAAVTSRDEYVGCTISIDGKGSFSSYEGAASIRGRGNSTWLWYDKKPYRIKLNEKSEILGLGSDKDWVLLANYRDPTFLMNAFAFAVADFMKLPFTNHSRFVEVTLNGSYMGLYQLTEQIEQGTNRVAVADVGGLLLSLDEDDGPAAAPTAGDNFTSTVFELPVCVKYPENQTAAQLAAIKAELAKVESAVQAANYDAVAQLVDVASLIDFLLVQELTYNVELVTPRSMYLHRDPGGRFVLGPVWDFDGGFDFDWTDMMTSHDYFAAQDLVMGADPARSGTVSSFWVNLFKNPRFVSEFKARWRALSPTLLPHAWGIMENDVASLSAALERNAERWPIGKQHDVEIARMKQWLETRVLTLNSAIDAYPNQ